MARLGYKCDECGDEHRRREPAAYVAGDELCADCYDERMEEFRASQDSVYSSHEQ